MAACANYVVIQLSQQQQEIAMWPFPPPQGPTPWTAKQKADYAKQQRQQLPTAPF
jgi:hypothetical protein